MIHLVAMSARAFAQHMTASAAALDANLLASMKRATLKVWADARDRSNWGNRDDKSPLLPPGPLRALSGHLLRGINWKVEKSGTDYMGYIGTNVFYGKLHELGEGKMPARPFLAPAIQRKQDAVNKEIGKAVTETVKKANG